MKARKFRDIQKIEEIIRKCDVCNVGVVDENMKPYVFTMNFGYEERCIYLHSAHHGKKIDILGKNPHVFAVFSTGHELYIQSPSVACSYGMKYKSVHASGKVEFIDDYEEKIKALNIIMKNYTDREFIYNSPAVKNVKVYRIVTDEMTGKEFGHL
jgi:nitroimidazol reductase NimA-like FMN-containing flavoprotein (pyridoxamine 5'-phosphate oxidase superfamily)